MRALRRVLLLSGLFLFLVLATGVSQAGVLRVGRDAPDVASAVAMASSGDVIEVPPGRWKGPVRLDRAVTLLGVGGTLDGGGVGTVLFVEAPGARVENLAIENSGYDLGGPDTCVFVDAMATGAVVKGNRLEDCAFGIWVHETDGAQILDNRVQGRSEVRSSDRGNGIHLFNASRLVVRGNVVREARDGIYVSATEDSLIEGNTVSHQRFGVHYMYSYRNELRGNVSDHNIVGFALMESMHLVVEENQAIGNTRNGILFRDVQFSKIRRNRIEANGSGMFFFSSTENILEENEIVDNELGMKIWAGTRRNNVVRNRIVGNRQQVFYVGAEDQEWGADGQGNFWGDYVGWDQDGDGVGDRPHRVDSFKARIIYQYPSAALLLRSPALEMLAHMAERFPLMRTPTIVDLAPLVGAPILGAPMSPGFTK